MDERLSVLATVSLSSEIQPLHAEMSKEEDAMLASPKTLMTWSRWALPVEENELNKNGLPKEIPIESGVPGSNGYCIPTTQTGEQLLRPWRLCDNKSSHWRENNSKDDRSNNHYLEQLKQVRDGNDTYYIGHRVPTLSEEAKNRGLFDDKYQSTELPKEDPTVRNKNGKRVYKEVFNGILHTLYCTYIDVKCTTTKKTIRVCAFKMQYNLPTASEITRHRMETGSCPNVKRKREEAIDVNGIDDARVVSLHVLAYMASNQTASD